MALPTLTCQLSCAFALDVNVGNGPGLLLLPVSHDHDGAGIDGIHDWIVAHPPSSQVSAKSRSAVETRAVISRRCRLVQGCRGRIPLRLQPADHPPHRAS